MLNKHLLSLTIVFSISSLVAMEDENTDSFGIKKLHPHDSLINIKTQDGQHIKAFESILSMSPRLKGTFETLKENCINYKNKEFFLPVPLKKSELSHVIKGLLTAKKNKIDPLIDSVAGQNKVLSSKTIYNAQGKQIRVNPLLYWLSKIYPAECSDVMAAAEYCKLPLFKKLIETKALQTGLNLLDQFYKDLKSEVHPYLYQDGDLQDIKQLVLEQFITIEEKSKQNSAYVAQIDKVDAIYHENAIIVRVANAGSKKFELEGNYHNIQQPILFSRSNIAFINAAQDEITINSLSLKGGSFRSFKLNALLDNKQRADVLKTEELNGITLKGVSPDGKMALIQRRYTDIRYIFQFVNLENGKVVNTPYLYIPNVLNVTWSSKFPYCALILDCFGKFSIAIYNYQKGNCCAKFDFESQAKQAKWLRDGTKLFIPCDETHVKKLVDMDTLGFVDDYFGFSRLTSKQIILLKAINKSRKEMFEKRRFLIANVKRKSKKQLDLEIDHAVNQLKYRPTDDELIELDNIAIENDQVKKAFLAAIEPYMVRVDASATKPLTK